jgi:ABC-2 type transport system permease protein
MSLETFYRRNRAFFKLGILSNLEYRFNFAIDALIQPIIGAGVEVLLWSSIFAGLGVAQIGGFTQAQYLAYFVWAAFISRIAISWMYEFKMIEEIESGSVNGLLVRPLSFYEYYLAQFFGYKIVTTAISLIVPLSVSYYFKLPVAYEKLPIILVLMFYYLILIHTLSFLVMTLSFHLNKISGFTVAKNITLWLLSGELVPIDLIPQPYQSWILSLPFANGVYIPVGYLTGRISSEVFYQGFMSITLSLITLAIMSVYMWRWGLKTYSGTGA